MAAERMATCTEGHAPFRRIRWQELALNGAFATINGCKRHV